MPSKLNLIATNWEHWKLVLCSMLALFYLPLILVRTVPAKSCEQQSHSPDVLHGKGCELHGSSGSSSTAGWWGTSCVMRHLLQSWNWIHGLLKTQRMTNGLVHFLEEKEHGTITVLIATSVLLTFSLAHFASTSGCFSLKEVCILKLKMYLSICKCCAVVVGLSIIKMFKTFVVFFPVGYNRLRGICSKRPC